jgi:hypothetical protein
MVILGMMLLQGSVGQGLVECQGECRQHDEASSSAPSGLARHGPDLDLHLGAPRRRELSAEARFQGTARWISTRWSPAATR